MGETNCDCSILSQNIDGPCLTNLLVITIYYFESRACMYCKSIELIEVLKLN